MSKTYAMDTARKAWGAGRKSGPRTAARFAFSIVQGQLEYIGRCISSENGIVEIAAWDALLFLMTPLCEESGETKRVPETRCLLFSDKEAMLDCAYAMRDLIGGVK